MRIFCKPISSSLLSLVYVRNQHSIIISFFGLEIKKNKLNEADKCFKFKFKFKELVRIPKKHIFNAIITILRSVLAQITETEISIIPKSTAIVVVYQPSL